VGGEIPENGQILTGIVDKVSFLGNAYELEVLLPEDRITVRTGQHDFVKGEVVKISLPSQLHYITE
jgi:hypothetical protein